MCIDSVTVCLKKQDFVQRQLILCISPVKDKFLRRVDHFAYRLLHIRNLFCQSSATNQHFVLGKTFIDFNFDFHNFFALSFSPLSIFNCWFGLVVTIFPDSLFCTRHFFWRLALTILDFLTEFSIFDAPDPVNRFEVRGNFSVVRHKKGRYRMQYLPFFTSYKFFSVSTPVVKNGLSISKNFPSSAFSA